MNVPKINRLHIGYLGPGLFRLTRVSMCLLRGC
jgi:hypothetical protein